MSHVASAAPFAVSRCDHHSPTTNGCVSLNTIRVGQMRRWRHALSHICVRKHPQNGRRNGAITKDENHFAGDRPCSARNPGRSTATEGGKVIQNRFAAGCADARIVTGITECTARAACKRGQQGRQRPGCLANFPKELLLGALEGAFAEAAERDLAAH